MPKGIRIPVDALEDCTVHPRFQAKFTDFAWGMLAYGCVSRGNADRVGIPG